MTFEDFNEVLENKVYDANYKKFITHNNNIWTHTEEVIDLNTKMRNVIYYNIRTMDIIDLEEKRLPFLGEFDADCLKWVHLI